MLLTQTCASPSSDGACLSSEVSGGQGNGLNVAVVAEGRAQSQGGDVVGESTAGAAVLWVLCQHDIFHQPQLLVFLRRICEFAVRQV